MLTGVVLQSNPTRVQKKTFSQWMGCGRFIWNAKCDEDYYLRNFANKYLPIGTYPESDQTYSQYKNKELSPWLFECPSQILRNMVYRWYKTQQNFMKGLCQRPKKKRKSDTDSIHLTKELFSLEKCPDGVTRLFIGTKTNNIGYLSVKFHKKFKEPNSIYIKRRHGKYTVSCCYEDERSDKELFTQEEHLKYLKKMSEEELEKITIGIDRGVQRPVQAGEVLFDFSLEQKSAKKRHQGQINQINKKLSRQQKGSNRSKKQKNRRGRKCEKIANIRKDFSHKTSASIVNNTETKIIVLEDLKTKQMTKKPKPKKNTQTGKWEKNNRKSKAGLNKAILDKNWHQLEIFLQYKAYRAGKAIFKVPAHHTSQECAGCGHTHPDNRKTQSEFICGKCGHTDHADKNAAEVIKKRAINLILYSGTELSDRGVLLDKGRGAASKTGRAKGESCTH